MRRQSQPYRDEQRRVQMARQREEALSVERNRRMSEMLQAKQAAKLAGGTRTNQTTDRMVFSNGVAKLTRPLTPGEIRRGFTGKITPDGRAFVKFRDRVFAVPASGLGIKLGSAQGPKAQLLSSSSLSTGQRRVLQESTAHLAALDADAKSKGRILTARGDRVGEASSVRPLVTTSNHRISAEGLALRNAHPEGSALKSDPYHRAATFMRMKAAEHGHHFRIVGGDGHARTLTQIPGEVNEERGRFEYIVDQNGRLVHQRFVKNGTINGKPNVP